MRILFLSDTHLGLDLPLHPRVERRRRGHDFFDNFERALAPAFAGQIDVVVHGGDLHYRSRVPAWIAEAALAPLKRVASMGIPVVLVLGNHERSRLPFPLFGLHDHLHVIDRPRTIVVTTRGLRVAFVGFPYARQVRQRFRTLLEDARRGAETADVSVLCVHQCVEDATCGPGNFTFRTGDEVIRARDLPPDVCVTLAGHIHRHQVVQHPGRTPVIYAGSVERTSFAEAPETKGYVTLDVSQRGLDAWSFHPLPARPMVALTLRLDDASPDDAHAIVARAIAATPHDAVVQLRAPEGIPPGLTAAKLRAMSGARNVDVAHAERRHTHARPRIGKDAPTFP